MIVFWPDERWLPIPGYEGTYEVSDMGRVRSLDRFITNRNGTVKRRRGQIIAQGVRGDRRLQVILKLNGNAATKKVHQLVLAAFVGPLPEGQHTRHLNDLCQDNRLVNLAYGTRADNSLDMIRNGSNHETKKTHCPAGHLYDDANTYRMPNRPTWRYCRECTRVQGRKYYLQKKERAQAQRAAGVAA